MPPNPEGKVGQLEAVLVEPSEYIVEGRLQALANIHHVHHGRGLIGLSRINHVEVAHVGGP
jgi:hypothetical protein